MMFDDLSDWQPYQPQEIPVMQAKQVLHKLLQKVCSEMHKLRRTTLFVNVMAALQGEVLTVTHLSGGPLPARPKRSIVSNEPIGCCPIAACRGSA